MKKVPYPIVVIDEEDDQLQEIGAAFQTANIPYTSLLYDSAYLDEPYSGIELLFLDVNLNPGGGQGDMVIFSFL